VLWYTAAIVPPPLLVLQQLERATFNFLWSGKRSGPINRLTAIVPKHLGGLGVVDIASVCAAFQLKLLKQAIVNCEPAWTAFYWAEMEAQSAARKFALDRRLILAHPTPSHHHLDPSWRKTLLTAQQLDLREADPIRFEDVLRQHLFLNRHITSPNGSTLSSAAMASAASLLTSRVIDIANIDDSGVHTITANRIRAAIPPAWRQIIVDGPTVPAVGEFFVDGFITPASQVFEVTDVNDQHTRCTVYDVDRHGVIQRPSRRPARTIATQRFPLGRAHISHQRSNDACLGAIATTPIIPDQITINQLIDKKLQRVSIGDLTINSTTKALTSLKHTVPDFDRKWTGILRHHPSWKRVLKWVWCRNRNRKVNDFLFKVLHRRLPVGENRDYADNPACPCGIELETHHHLLVHCASIKRFWQWFARAVRSSTSIHISIDNTSLILASVPPSRIRKQHRAKHRLLEIAHGEALYSIWLQRCNSFFDDQPFDSEYIAALLRSRLRLAIQAAQHLKRIDGFTDLATSLISQLDAPI
jgi:hypothetical protein